MTTRQLTLQLKRVEHLLADIRKYAAGLYVHEKKYPVEHWDDSYGSIRPERAEEMVRWIEHMRRQPDHGPVKIPEE